MNNNGSNPQIRVVLVKNFIVTHVMRQMRPDQQQITRPKTVRVVTYESLTDTFSKKRQLIFRMKMPPDFDVWKEFFL